MPPRCLKMWLPLAAIVDCTSGRQPDPEEYTGELACEIDRVIDGDTVDIKCDGFEPRSARLQGFDTPEISRPRCDAEASAGFATRAALIDELRSENRVRVKLNGQDRFGRLLAVIAVDNSFIADRMIDGGHAVAYDGGPRQDWCAALDASGAGFDPIPITEIR